MAELGCPAPLALQGPRQLRGTLCGLCGCRNKKASDGPVLTFAGRGGRGWLRTRQAKKSAREDSACWHQASSHAGPLQARQSWFSDFRMDWVVGVRRGLAQQRRRACAAGAARLWQSLGAAVPGGACALFSWARLGLGPPGLSTWKRAPAGHLQEPWGLWLRRRGTAGQAVQVKPRRRILWEGGLRTRVPTCFPSWESIAGRLYLARSREILLPGTCSLATAPARDSPNVPWCSAHAGLPLATLKKTITPSLGGDVSQTFNSKESTCKCRRCRLDSLGGNGSLEREMAAHSSSLAWRIQWTQEPGKLQPKG